MMSSTPIQPLFSLAWSACLLYAAYLTAATAVDPSTGVSVLVGMLTLNSYRPRNHMAKGRQNQSNHKALSTKIDNNLRRQDCADESVDEVGLMSAVLAQVERVVVRPYTLALMSWGLVVPLVMLAYVNAVLAVGRPVSHLPYGNGLGYLDELPSSCFFAGGAGLAQLDPESTLGSLLNSAIPFTLVILGARLRLSAYKALGPNFTFMLNEPQKLITSGPYAWVRHPSYTGTLLVWAGAVALTWRGDDVLLCCFVLQGDESDDLRMRWAVSGVVISLYVLVRALVIGLRVPKEERMMREVFGPEWERYREVVKWRLVPHIW